MSDSEVLYEKIVHENMEKAFQLRAVVNVFREVEYLHIRKYFLSFEGEWTPSKEGVSMPMSIPNVFNLLDALVEICAKAEGVDTIQTHFKDKLTDLTKTT